MSLEQLTRRQKAVLDAVQRFSTEWGYMPSVAELARELGLAKSTVHFHIVSLKRKGRLTHDGTDHGLKLLSPSSPKKSTTAAASIPIVGTIAAGVPIEAFEEQDQEISVPTALVRGKTFALRVKGLSMVEDGILDGDLVIVRSQPTVDQGEVAVALLEDGTATLKRIYREARRIRLQPANASMKPVYVDRVQIQGKVVGVLRLYS